MGLVAGSLFTGCMGLDLGLEALGVEFAWACESNKACRNVIAQHRPELPVAEDVRELGDVERVDMLVGGFPCQDLSYAGKGAGLAGDRSALWFAYADAIRVLRPRLVLVENVPGLATRGQGRVLYDLAESGYVGSWFRVRASDVGAPHGRERIFIVARDATADADLVVSRRSQRSVEAGRRRPRAPGDSEAAADAAGVDAKRSRDAGVVPRAQGEARDEGRRRDARGDAVVDRGEVAADAGRERRDGRRARDEEDTTARRRRRRAGAAGSPEAAADAGGERRRLVGAPHDDDGRDARRHDADRRRPVAADADGERREPGIGWRATRSARAWLVEAQRFWDGYEGPTEQGTAVWGEYAAAVERWEYLYGPAPRPTDDRGRLSPEFVEWMLGYPVEWTAGVSRTARLRMLGNSVHVQAGIVAAAALLEIGGVA